MNYLTDHHRHLSHGRIGGRHGIFRNHTSLNNKYELIQRIIILAIIISCIALVATVVVQF